MRIVGDIPHPYLKISIFKMDNKLSVKFETGLLEQIYKFRNDFPTENVEDLKRLVTPAFIESVEKTFETMQIQRLHALEAAAKTDEQDDLPIII
ncbi:MAG: hypothetical protein RL757_2054 [Bacteroidota bacterium]|jgi:hypothetical protein